MHSLLSLHAPARAAATDPLREVLLTEPYPSLTKPHPNLALAYPNPSLP